MRDATTEAELAVHLVRTTGDLLLSVRDADVFSAGGLGKAGDQTANQFLIDTLHDQWPDDALLLEQVKCDGLRLAPRRVWIVNPVDGTHEYGEGCDDWAVHVGCAIDCVAVVGLSVCRMPAHQSCGRLAVTVQPSRSLWLIC